MDQTYLTKRRLAMFLLLRTHLHDRTRLPAPEPEQRDAVLAHKANFAAAAPFFLPTNFDRTHNMSARFQPRSSGSRKGPPDRNNPNSKLPKGHYVELDDEAIHKSSKGLGVRSFDKYCLQCFDEADEEHRRSWRDCRAPCPICPGNEQHNGRPCPRLMRVQRNPSWWLSHAEFDPFDRRAGRTRRGRSASPPAALAEALRDASRQSSRLSNSRPVAPRSALDDGLENILSSARSSRRSAQNDTKPTGEEITDAYLSQPSSSIKDELRSVRAQNEMLKQTMLFILMSNNLPIPELLQPVLRDQQAALTGFTGANQPPSGFANQHNPIEFSQPAGSGRFNAPHPHFGPSRALQPSGSNAFGAPQLSAYGSFGAPQSYTSSFFASPHSSNSSARAQNHPNHFAGDFRPLQPTFGGPNGPNSPKSIKKVKEEPQDE
ncbi:hypothetical protein CC80DRAFT_502064 [Byssothecium circinans]|uniref:Uncharacterized protein n=1 Tax=Byssothecium circinans TaxID=147558 RepID=A0A6A5U5E7_9PLEO|nr:hypothetical protein CC80DRAFT_502064 [Byssothecium circinans]